MNRVNRFGLIYHLIVILAIGWSHKIHGQDNNQQILKSEIEPLEYKVGFQLLEEQDYSRMVNGGLSFSTVHPRPVRIYLWYPAKESNNLQRMHFSQYVALADEDIWPVEITGKLHEKLKYSHRPLVRSLGPERFEELLQQPVFANEKAEALEGPFPLIVIGQGLYYESPIVFAAMSEYLAGNGFVVATCPLVGTNSPIVRIDEQDLESQVRDLEFIIAQARRFSFVSPDKLGVFGFDMGGMAGLILSMRNPDVDAFVSVSSGILSMHPSGVPASSPDYDPLSLRIPWMHSIPNWWFTYGIDTLAGSLFEKAIHSERYLLLTEGMGHVDYTSYALIKGRSEMRGYWGSENPDAPKQHKAVRQYISYFFSAFLKNNHESLLFLSQDPRESITDSTMTLQHRSAAPATIDYEEFVQDIIAGNAEEAINEVRVLGETNPDHILLDEEYLRRLVVSLRDTWDLTEEVMPVIRFMAELYPLSDGPQLMLAEGNIDAGNYSAAIEVYSNLLKSHPDNNWIKSRIEWLRKQ